MQAHIYFQFVRLCVCVCVCGKLQQDATDYEHIREYYCVIVACYNLQLTNHTINSHMRHARVFK